MKRSGMWKIMVTFVVAIMMLTGVVSASEPTDVSESVVDELGDEGAEQIEESDVSDESEEVVEQESDESEEVPGEWDVVSQSDVIRYDKRVATLGSGHQTYVNAAGNICVYEAGSMNFARYDEAYDYDIAGHGVVLLDGVYHLLDMNGHSIQSSATMSELPYPATVNHVADIGQGRYAATLSQNAGRGNMIFVDPVTQECVVYPHGFSGNGPISFASITPFQYSDTIANWFAIVEYSDSSEFYAVDTNGSYLYSRGTLRELQYHLVPTDNDIVGFGPASQNFNYSYAILRDGKHAYVYTNDPYTFAFTEQDGSPKKFLEADQYDNIGHASVQNLDGTWVLLDTTGTVIQEADFYFELHRMAIISEIIGEYSDLKLVKVNVQGLGTQYVFLDPADSLVKFRFDSGDPHIRDAFFYNAEVFVDQGFAVVQPNENDGHYRISLEDGSTTHGPMSAAELHPPVVDMLVGDLVLDRQLVMLTNGKYAYTDGVGQFVFFENNGLVMQFESAMPFNLAGMTAAMQNGQLIILTVNGPM